METHSAKLAVEAALFSAGKPVPVSDLADTTGYTKAQVTRAIESLVEEYRERDTALEVAKAGEKWAMQVKSAYAEGVTKLAPMEIPFKLLKTLALIAYHQPILQSDLQDMVGSKVYDHMNELRELGLVRRRRHERTYMITTTPEFPEYFGIAHVDRDEIKRYLAEKVGIPLPDDDGRGNKKLTAYEEGDGDSPEAADAESGADEADAAPEAGTDAKAPADAEADAESEAPGDAEALATAE